MKRTRDRLGHEMDQFQANLRALDKPTAPAGRQNLPGGDTTAAARTAVPYPENEIWAAAVRAWAPAPAEDGTAPDGPVTGAPPEPARGVHDDHEPDRALPPESSGGDTRSAASPERVDSCRGLRPGAAIQARGPRGVVAFEGTVDEVLPALDLFWAVSAQGNRRIIEFDEYDVYTG